MIGFYNYTVVLTYLGLLSAVVGISSAIDGHVAKAVICLMLAGLCDMFDGAIAKTRDRNDAEKHFGVQIDSLTDLVCFGVLPAVIGYSIGLKSNLQLGILFAYILAALIRLAYYNVMEEERRRITPGEKRIYYEGLPVTNVALIIPIVFGFRKSVGAHYFPLVYAVTLIITSFLFLTKIKVKKAGLKTLFLIACCGIFILIWLIRNS